MTAHLVIFVERRQPEPERYTWKPIPEPSPSRWSWVHTAAVVFAVGWAAQAISDRSERATCRPGPQSTFFSENPLAGPIPPTASAPVIPDIPDIGTPPQK